MDIEKNGYPEFFIKILRMNRKNDEQRLSESEKQELNRRYKEKTNKSIQCPMNYLTSVDFKINRSNKSTLGMENFFVKFELEESRRKSKKVEELIERYSIDLYNANVSGNEEDYLLLRDDFDQLIKDIRETYISKSYLGLISWLIDRAFCITPSVKSNSDNMHSTLYKNKSILLKTLYDVNKVNLLMCFSKNVKNVE